MNKRNKVILKVKEEVKQVRMMKAMKITLELGKHIGNLKTKRVPKNGMKQSFLEGIVMHILGTSQLFQCPFETKIDMVFPIFNTKE